MADGPDSTFYDHPAAIDPEQLLKQCRTYRSRRAGPGGQHRNKVETAVTLEHGPSGVRGSASERRSQAENHRVALFRLRVELALAVRQPLSDGYAPSPVWRSRLHHSAIRINPKHNDFPSLLAEALDVIAAHVYAPQAAAVQLGCSSTQLIKMLKLEHKALALVNQQRSERGMHKLK